MNRRITGGRVTGAVLAVLLGYGAASAQAIEHRGFVEGAAFAFPHPAPNDATQGFADLLAREEVVIKPATWFQFAGGVDLRANSHDQVEDEWSAGWFDRGIRRPRLSIRRLSATIAHGPLALDLGKQFIRWGKTDIVAPTDRFAPRDFLNGVDSELLPVTAVRAAVQFGGTTIEAVWVPRFTPSRIPLVQQRWAVLPAAPAGARLTERPPAYPSRSQAGIRWAHTGGRLDYSLSVFDGFNHLPGFRSAVDADAGTTAPALEIVRVYPRIRTYGVDAAVPLRWLTVKGEAAYFESASQDEYVLYVLQLEVQRGPWVLVGGYAGEAVTRRRELATFAPDRGMSRAIVARISRTIGTNRSVDVEGAARQTGRGAYGRARYSHGFGRHWRATLSVVGLGGRDDDFLGQYDLNSHAVVSVRYSF